MSTMPLDKEVAVSEHGAVYSVIFPCLCHTYVILAVEAPDLIRGLGRLRWNLVR